MRYTGRDKMTISKEEIDNPVIGDIDIIFDRRTNTLTVDISYSPVIKGKEARQKWDQLNMSGDIVDLIHEAKIIAGMTCGITDYNEKTNKPEYVFFRSLVTWFAFKKLCLSNTEISKIFNTGIANIYVSIERIANTEALGWNQKYWRSEFMNKIKELK